MKKPLQRTCMGCNNKKEKTELIRIARNKEEQIYVDEIGKGPGRGAYICKDINCLEKVIKNNRLQRTLGTKIPKEIYENLRGVIIGKQ